MAARSGISNRQSPEEEARDRAEHPPLDAGSPPPADAAGRTGEQPLTDSRDRHTSHKAGSRSIAQKESGSRYADHSMPAARKVAGAFGREPEGPSARDRKETSHPARGDRGKSPKTTGTQPKPRKADAPGPKPGRKLVKSSAGRSAGRGKHSAQRSRGLKTGETRKAGPKKIRPRTTTRSGDK